MTLTSRANGAVLHLSAAGHVGQAAGRDAEDAGGIGHQGHRAADDTGFHRRPQRREHSVPRQVTDKPRTPVSDFTYPPAVFGVLRSHANRAVIIFWYTSIVARYTLSKGGVRSLRVRLG